MAKDNPARADPLGAQKCHERPAHHRADRPPRCAQNIGGLADGQRQNGQGHIAQIAQGVLRKGHIARRRQDQQRGGKDQDQHDAQPEIRNTDPKDHKSFGQAAHPRPARRGPNPKRNADGTGQQHRQDGQFQCHRQALRQQFRQGGMADNVAAKVAADHATDPLKILRQQATVQPQLVAQFRDIRLGRAKSQHRAHRVARNQPQDQEHDDTHQPQRRNGDQNPPQHKARPPVHDPTPAVGAMPARSTNWRIRVSDSLKCTAAIAAAASPRCSAIAATNA